MTVDVVFVTGLARSGSTLFETLVADALGCPSTGELVMVFERGILEDRPCRCGEAFSDCSFWAEVVARAPEMFTCEIATQVVAATAAVTRGLDSRRLMSRRSRRVLVARIPRCWREAMGALITGVAEVAGTSAFVDSSKLPVLAFLLDGVPGVRVHPVHLVRDPRAVAWSWANPHRNLPGVPDFPSLPPARAALLWLAVNMAAERLPVLLGEPPRRVRYEDVALAPDSVVGAVAGALAPDLPGLAGEGRPLRMDPGQHTMAGNPGVRLATDPARVTIDDRWRFGMSRGAAAIVTAVALPLLHRYGYPLLPHLESGVRSS